MSSHGDLGFYLLLMGLYSRAISPNTTEHVFVIYRLLLLLQIMQIELILFLKV